MCFLVGRMIEPSPLSGCERITRLLIQTLPQETCKEVRPEHDRDPAGCRAAVKINNVVEVFMKLLLDDFDSFFLTQISVEFLLKNYMSLLCMICKTGCYSHKVVSAELNWLRRLPK